jgi:uncharacterized membrane protein YfcA
VIFQLVVFAVAVVSGATAAISGFGIGSLMTPLLAVRLGTPLAVAAVAIPHAAATTLRFWRLRDAVDWRTLTHFGLVSAAGGLAGAVFAGQLGSRALTVVLGALLVLTGLGAATGFNTRWPATGVAGSILGFLSGLFGGLAGNQGGLRAAALLGAGLTPAAFVATSTATALMVDAARTPVYLAQSGRALAALWPLLGVATAGVLIGTLFGDRILMGMRPATFRRVVGALIGVIGGLILLKSV